MNHDLALPLKHLSTHLSHAAAPTESSSSSQGFHTYPAPHSLCADPRTSADPGQEAGRCLVGAAGCGSERADLGKHRMLVGLREQPRAAGLAPVSWEQPRWCGRAGPGACTDSQLLSADFRAAVPSGPWFSHSSNDPTAS